MSATPGFGQDVGHTRVWPGCRPHKGLARMSATLRSRQDVGHTRVWPGCRSHQGLARMSATPGFGQDAPQDTAVLNCLGTRVQERFAAPAHLAV
eukprot:179130-Chlamydomonas_euryale.AAC.3